MYSLTLLKQLIHAVQWKLWHLLSATMLSHSKVPLLTILWATRLFFLLSFLCHKRQHSIMSQQVTVTVLNELCKSILSSHMVTSEHISLTILLQCSILLGNPVFFPLDTDHRPKQTNTPWWQWSTSRIICAVTPPHYKNCSGTAKKSNIKLKV